MSDTSELIKLLEARGVRINVGGCGCCDSPWLQVQIDGVTVYDGENVGIEMIDGERAP